MAPWIFAGDVAMTDIAGIVEEEVGGNVGVDSNFSILIAYSTIPLRFFSLYKFVRLLRMSVCINAIH